MGEVGVAVYVARRGITVEPGEVQDWLASRVARYKQPKEFPRWEALPKSGYGKLAKRLIRQELAGREPAP
ncbi:hypothetical protein BAY61_17770 [Prauserella marina]|uniref:Fatty-acyl-CoA synthase n=1 Tax=Prauserella marina TaxID=530584 RepID=A0A222VS32_9PSEU|nr:hypothetical protein [Prauserella marina]ASR36543.1 hypothetical protein BAY61_17770 [Prauserella marina]PWV73939.1 hypothetical protein DES30_108112 [Prauserella marina]SDD59391.1 fatty-acyl-CoA synthase [Prauserella marina]